MAKGPFKFRLERVREMRVRAEDEAKEELARAMQQRARCAALLDDARARVDCARSEQLGASGGAGVSIAHLHAHQAFLERAEREAQAAELELSRQDAEVAARRTALADAARERQVLDQLKDKQALAHRREADRIEAAHIDELALAMHRRRGAA
jgi:flagellar protein FliJ